MLRFGTNLRRRVVIFVLLAATAAHTQPATTRPVPSTERIRIDYVFLIDVSKSMIGAGNHENIFPGVIKTISGFVDRLEAGTTVYVIPFAEAVGEAKEFTINERADLADVVAYLHSLEATGNKTAVYDSIKAALDVVKSRRGEAHRADHAVVLHVYTDGDDNVSGLTLTQILEDYKLNRGPYDWLFYTELGLPRSAEKQAAFSARKDENVVYVSEKAGEVRPIVQIEALLPFLNFGNVVEGEWPSRSMKFAIRTSHALPPKLTVSIEPRFDDLRAAGVLAEIEPSRFPVDSSEKLLKLTLKNLESLPRGKYNGRLRLDANDPYVIVIPSEITTTFSYEVPKLITLSPAPGERLPIEFGMARPKTTVARHFRLEFGEAAANADSKVTVRFHELSGNPADLGLGQTIYVEGFRGQKLVTLGKDVGEVILVAEPPEGIAPGTYSGSIELMSDTATILVEGSSDSDTSAVQIPWHLTIPEPPIPWWMWLLLVAAVITVAVLFYRVLNRPPTFTDMRLQILTPRQGVIDLANRHSIRFGPGSPDLDIPTELTIRARKKDRRIVAMLEVEGDGVSLIRKNSRIDVFGSEELFAGDTIEVPPYQLRVDSYALGSEDQV